MRAGYFVTGTDTGVGKTLASCALLHAFRAAGHSAAGMKAVSAGGDDAERLARAGAHRVVCPYALNIPVSPHIAARREGVRIDPGRIREALLEISADIAIVEGVGGFFVPLDEDLLVSDLARQLALPVIVVVGMRLGCLNHALLTFDAVRRSGLELAGWIASCIDPEMICLEENLATLSLRAPLIGTIPFDPEISPQKAGEGLDLSRLPRFRNRG